MSPDILNVSGQPEMCLDSSRCVQTVQTMSSQPKILSLFTRLSYGRFFSVTDPEDFGFLDLWWVVHIIEIRMMLMGVDNITMLIILNITTIIIMVIVIIPIIKIVIRTMLMEVDDVTMLTILIITTTSMMTILRTMLMEVVSHHDGDSDHPAHQNRDQDDVDGGGRVEVDDKRS